VTAVTLRRYLPATLDGTPVAIRLALLAYCKF
jgi:hypothetical protein